KMLGEVPEGAGVMWQNRPVLMSLTGLGRKVQKWDQLDANLKSFAHMAVAAQVGCSFCLDFGYFQAHNEGLDEVKASEVPRWRELDGVHLARTGRDGICRGHDRDTAAGHRRALRPPARQARRSGDGGAHRVRGVREPDD